VGNNFCVVAQCLLITFGRGISRVSDLSPGKRTNRVDFKFPITRRNINGRPCWSRFGVSARTHFRKEQCRIHLSSAGVSLNVIFNMLFSSGCISKKRVCDNKCDGADVYVISFSPPHRYSCCISPEARAPPAADRPARDREFRHVRGDSQTLAGGLLPTLFRTRSSTVLDLLCGPESYNVASCLRVDYGQALSQICGTVSR
jgi:hypothetical protein